ncbi:MAG: DNA-directed RNA polymerase subunit K [Desulfurococcaceae archaeon]
MSIDLASVYKRVIGRRLTKYEIARVIGARALQLAMGAPPLVNINDIQVKDPIYIAIYELLNNVLPMSILRRKGEGEGYELIPVGKLITPEIRRYLSTIFESWDIGHRI